MDIMGIVDRGDSRNSRARKYIPIVFTEESVYRVILLGFVFHNLNPWIAVPLSAIIFGVSHFALFRWPMVLCATALGLINGIPFYLSYTHFGTNGLIIAFIGCIIMHLIVGLGGWSLGLFAQWRK